MNTKVKSVLFRCDAGDDIGGGHLIRCLTFAQALRSENVDCFFLCNEQAFGFPAWQNSGFKKLKTDDLTDQFFDYIIVDHYELDQNYEKTLRPYCDQILVIDDLANRSHECDILLDASPSRKAEDYASFVPEACTLCIGLDFLLIRDEFLKHKRPTKLNNNPHKIFVTMGSIDGQEILPSVLEFLENYTPRLDVNILMTHRTKTLERVRHLAQSSSHNVELHIDIPNPFDMMQISDLAISAGGMTCLELVSLNVPTWAIIVADNQRENVNFLNQNGYVQDIHNYKTMDGLNLNLWLENPNFKKLKTNDKLKIIEFML